MKQYNGDDDSDGMEVEGAKTEAHFGILVDVETALCLMSKWMGVMV